MAVYTESVNQNGTSISWGAIFAGALASAALAIILSVLGSGFGLAVVSPWSNSGIGAAAFGISAILWLSVTQIIASGFGGFLAGRLRVKWDGVASDEVYFRDTAHGFLTWAIALIVSVSLFASLLGSIVNNGVQSAAILANHATSAHHVGSPGKINNAQAYYLDSLFRRDIALADGISLLPENPRAVTPEIHRIFAQSLQNGSVSPADLKYVGQRISLSTGLPQEVAEKRVKDTYALISDAELATKMAADEARKASAYVTLWGFIALLIGAFTASFAATWGGRCRDDSPRT